MKTACVQGESVPDNTREWRESCGCPWYIAARVVPTRRVAWTGRGSVNVAGAAPGHNRTDLMPRVSALRPILGIDFCSHPAHYHHAPSVALLLGACNYLESKQSVSSCSWMEL
jgi:hypothetical protein